MERTITPRPRRMTAAAAAATLQAEAADQAYTGLEQMYFATPDADYQRIGTIARMARRQADGQTAATAGRYRTLADLAEMRYCTALLAVAAAEIAEWRVTHQPRNSYALLAAELDQTRADDPAGLLAVHTRAEKLAATGPEDMRAPYAALAAEASTRALHCAERLPAGRGRDLIILLATPAEVQ